MQCRGVLAASGGMPEIPTITAAAARRAALAAQGLLDPPPSGTPTRRHLRRVLDRVRLLQIDSVNVVVRAHYMPIYSRLGPYPAALLDDAVWSDAARKPRLLAEYWAHEASLVPVGDWPLFRWRMAESAARMAHDPRRMEFEPGLGDEVLAAVKDLGPVSAGALERELGRPGKQGTQAWWNRSTTKRACELLFATGELTTAARPGFQRLYDLPERVLPAAVLAEEPPVEEAVRALVRRAAAALGVATEPDLRDYYRLPPARSKQALDELVEEGSVELVDVRGWRDTAYRIPGARVPRVVRGRALLCPFDPLIWRRERTERMFGFYYRIEIYVPRPKRRYGYYVFPFLLDGELVARVDLKADRAAGVLRVPGAFAEPEVDRGRVVAELAAELRTMADWLELDDIAVGESGDLAPALRAVCP